MVNGNGPEVQYATHTAQLLTEAAGVRRVRQTSRYVTRRVGWPATARGHLGTILVVIKQRLQSVHHPLGIVWLQAGLVEEN